MVPAISSSAAVGSGMAEPVAASEPLPAALPKRAPVVVIPGINCAAAVAVGAGAGGDAGLTAGVAPCNVIGGIDNAVGVVVARGLGGNGRDSTDIREPSAAALAPT